MKVDIQQIDNMIFIIRNKKVMLDSDLAKLYGVEVKRLNEQVRRNIDRFSSDFMFECNSSELADLRSQIATTNDLSV
ncbi:MAG: ORF6N domain-containing protein [Bacteriovoracaceae bacterium]|nr:ORF6N domain-containing protein [Bacteriovoracaceae bacterium]